MQKIFEGYAGYCIDFQKVKVEGWLPNVLRFRLATRAVQKNV